ncbi:25339_t:CDS:2, partial [Gigaspora margarita]
MLTKKDQKKALILLNSELFKFCCNNRKRIIPSLPAYPLEINNILNDLNISTYSQKLNALFSFTVIGVQGQFVQLPAPSSVSITG